MSDSPDRLVAAGKVANVPILYGDMRDEGTLFSLINSQNITTTEEVKDYFKTYWWPSISEEQLDRLMELYPQDPTKGSPFGTGLQYALPPQYKRIAALTGDYSFQVSRPNSVQSFQATDTQDRPSDASYSPSTPPQNGTTSPKPPSPYRL